MTEAQLVSAFGSVLGLAGLCVLYVVVRDYRADDLRDRLFALRDEMFLYSYDQGLLDTAAHRNLRLLLNSLIRYAHQVSFVRLLLISVVPRAMGIKQTIPEEMLEWKASVESLEPEQQERFKSFHARALVTLLHHVVLGSPILWLFYVWHKLTRYIRRPGGPAKGLRDRLPSVDNFESEALRTARPA